MFAGIRCAAPAVLTSTVPLLPADTDTVEAEDVMFMNTPPSESTVISLVLLDSANVEMVAPTVMVCVWIGPPNGMPFVNGRPLA